MDPSRATPATAGSLLIAAIVLCALIGFGVGSLVKSVAVFTVIGAILGIVVGFTLVYRRFKDL
ncbi:MAG: AtpZ/AtpI family protein [Solirubrobacterales bacterium]